MENNRLVAIVGSRTFKDKAFFDATMKKLQDDGKLDGVVGVVSGGAKGADLFGKFWAKNNGLEMHEYKPDWKAKGKAAGVMRNTDIVNKCDFVVAFPTRNPKQSRGTYDTIQKARKAHKTVFIFDDWDSAMPSGRMARGPELW